MKESNIFQKTLLLALNRRHNAGAVMYQGTVSDGTKAKRRAKDRAAKAARKAQRKARMR